MTWKHRITAFRISSSSSFDALKYLEYLGGWNSDSLFFNEKDLEKLMTYYDDREKENIIKRRDILNLMYELK